MTKQHYRAWCLSFEDSEEEGSDVVVYDVLTHDFAQRKRGVVYVPDTSVHNTADIAEAYADHVNSHRDGYECTWPLRFRVRAPDGSLQDFEVDRQLVSTFTASEVPVDLPPALHVLWGGRALCGLPLEPGSWPKGQTWISLRDVADGALILPEEPRCERCWARAPGILTGLQQIGAR